MNLFAWLIVLLLTSTQWTHAALPAQADETPRFTVHYEPAPFLAAGDVVSIEVRDPTGMDLRGQRLTVSVVEPAAAEIGSTDFFLSNDGSYRARLPFVWDTREMEPGLLLLRFSVEPAGHEWSEQVRLHPLPSAELGQRWERLELECCTIHYITGTRPEAELDALVAAAERQVARASQRLETTLPAPVSIIFLPRVIGHGGFAGEEIFISYPHVNYSNIDLELVLHHEIIHRLDRELGGPHRPALLVEGLAVYLSGGHFKEEDVVARSAALLRQGAYIPLQTLADDFYPSQHESGYMLAGALVQYMVETYGWEAYSAFYRDIQPPESGDSDAIDAALQAHFDINFAALEEAFLSYLRAQPDDARASTDVQLSLRFYDTLRSYQIQHDRTAYFRNVYLFPDPDVRERGIVSNWTRGPNRPINQVVERMLASAGEHLSAGRYEVTAAILSSVDFLLDGGLLLPFRPCLNGSLVKTNFPPVSTRGK